MSASNYVHLERYIDALDLRHFRGAELTPYWSRSRKGGANACPPPELWPNIVETLVVLDALREWFGSPIRITSSYRSPAYNAAVGGARFSQHLQFNAVDFQSRRVSPAALAQRLRGWRGRHFYNPVTKRPFVFKGGIGRYATFVHLDTRGHNADW